MYNKTFWIGFIVIYAVWQCIGFLVHQILLMPQYAAIADVFRPEIKTSLMFVSSLLYLYLFCRIFVGGYEGKGVGEGVRFGLLIGLFMSIPMAIDQYAVYPITPALAVWWFVVGVISWVIVGAIFAAIYRPTRV
jgi:hypothetical protein